MGKSDSAFRKHPAAVRALTVCGVAASVAGVGAAAWAADAQGGHPDLSRLGQIKLYPLAGSGVDPLSNTVGTNLSGLPLSTDAVSSVFQNGLPANSVPAVSNVLKQSSSSVQAAQAAQAEQMDQ
jgi:hypothetical protein